MSYGSTKLATPWSRVWWFALTSSIRTLCGPAGRPLMMSDSPLANDAPEVAEDWVVIRRCLTGFQQALSSGARSRQQLRNGGQIDAAGGECCG